MPKRNTEEYEDDDGFVENAPKSKTTASSKKQKRSVTNVKSAGDGFLPGGGQASSDGEFWELSGKRRLQISEFKGKHMINIREYYEKDGQMLPGKKGISLTLEQFDTVVTLLPHVETVLKHKGHVPKRPDYEGAPGGGDAELGEDEDEDEAAMDEDEVDADESTEQHEKTTPGKLPGRKNGITRGVRRKNFDDTSEDD